MNSRTKLALFTIFVGCAISCSTCGFFYYGDFQGQEWRYIGVSLGGGFVLGVVITWIVWEGHRRAVQKLTDNLSEVDVNSHWRTMILPMPLAQAEAHALEALQASGAQAIQHRKVGQISAMMSMNRCKVSIRLDEIDASSTHVEVHSEPANQRITFVDYGRNLDNVQRIMGVLETVSEGRAPSS